MADFNHIREKNLVKSMKLNSEVQKKRNVNAKEEVTVAFGYAHKA